MKYCEIQHILPPPYHPHSNGEAKRVVKTFKTTMKKSGNANTNLAQFLLQYRTTPHATGVSHHELLYNRKLCTRLDAMHPDIIYQEQFPVHRLRKKNGGITI